MPNCHALKSDYLQCTHHVTNEGDLCGTHANTQARRIQRAGPHQAGKCEAFLTTHRWCSHDALPNERLCENHNRIRQQSLLRVQRELDDNDRLTELIIQIPALTWQQVMDVMIEDTTREPHRRYDIGLRFFIRTNPVANVPIFNTRWNWAFGGRIGPEPLEIPPPAAPVAPPAPRAQRLDLIANDRQNVHTTAVSNQTNAGLEKILKVEVPKTQDTQRILTQEWLFNMADDKKPAFNTYLKVINDVNRWFLMKSCREHNDSLYRNVLRGTVALINTRPKETRNELFVRLWEECLESVDMCCEGHITRLCNVFVGFDDEFKPPIPFGEILQNKMAAIASSDAEEEEKRKQANAFFDEYAVPQAERVAWLEAF